MHRDWRYVSASKALMAIFTSSERAVGRAGDSRSTKGHRGKAARCYSSPFSPDILETLVEMNSILEDIQKSLDMYLETKRHAFPRFYFLSNDDLLEILGQSRNPEAVQPHLKKCFDNIKMLKIQKVNRGGYGGSGGWEGMVMSRYLFEALRGPYSPSKRVALLNHCSSSHRTFQNW